MPVVNVARQPRSSQRTSWRSKPWRANSDRMRQGLFGAALPGVPGATVTEGVVTVQSNATDNSCRRQMTHRDEARSQVLWMAGQASRAAKSGQIDDARWWHERAVCALWNMN
jgi:hypothetical protein